jgi:hypothetical protein
MERAGALDLGFAISANVQSKLRTPAAVLLVFLVVLGAKHAYIMETRKQKSE